MPILPEIAENWQSCTKRGRPPWRQKEVCDMQETLSHVLLLNNLSTSACQLWSQKVRGIKEDLIAGTTCCQLELSRESVAFMQVTGSHCCHSE